MSIGVGVIGTGVMGADHVRTLQRFVRGAEVRMVSDADQDRARAAVAGLPGARVRSDPLDVIADRSVDAVVITSADETHAEFAVAAIRAGKPVMCEKPLAPSLAEAAAVLESIGRAGEELLSVGFMRRFDPGYRELRTALRSGVVGTPLLVHCIARGVSAPAGTTTERVVATSVVHEFDIVPWLLGSPVTAVSWAAARPSSPSSPSSGPVAGAGLQDPQLVLLRTADGVLTTIEAFVNAGYGYDIRCEVVGEEGAVGLVEPARTRLDTGQRRAVSYGADWRSRFADAYRLELQAWVDSLHAGTPSPLASAADAVTASAVADAVLHAMPDPGRWMPVPPGRRGASTNPSLLVSARCGRRSAPSW